MIIKKRAQSTAEYAITLGLVIAVAAGVMQVVLKGAMKEKEKQAIHMLMQAGLENVTSSGFSNTTENAPLYNQEFRKTTVDSQQFVDKTIMEKGGLEKRYQKQGSATSSVNIETVNENVATLTD